jgi:hypothetical protein
MKRNTVKMIALARFTPVAVTCLALLAATTEEKAGEQDELEVEADRRLCRSR